MNALESIQAVCTIGALFLAAWTLAILRHYAADTKKIAETGVSQLENSQTPFVTPVMRPNPPDEGWGLENQGLGPAINGQMSFVQNGRQVRALPCLSAGTRYNMHNAFAPPGRKYRTLVTWGDAGLMHVRFENLPA
jgi:hypothetical protein